MQKAVGMGVGVFWGLVSLLGLGRASLAGHCESPRVTDPAAGCCNYKLRGSAKISNETPLELYEQPSGVFEDEAAAFAFARSLVPKLPLFEPFDDPSVQVVQGWHYAAGGLHAAVDYGKIRLMSGEDPSFQVRSIAEGKVISAYWDDWLGNTVVIEHRAPDGTRYRSIYSHLRNGPEADLAKARTISLKQHGGANENPNWKKYRAFADLPDPDPLYWGTEGQKTSVKQGDFVRAKQSIGWAGNTGAGGAGNGLDGDGKPQNVSTANVHLHVFFAVENPKREQGWLLLDPYGQYAKAIDSCYSELHSSRFYVPFSPTFSNLDLKTFQLSSEYFLKMGFGLQTLSFYLFHSGGSSTVKAVGSFQAHPSTRGQAVRYLVTRDELIHWVNQYLPQGLIPREVSVFQFPGKPPLYTVIWMHRPNTPFWISVDLGDREFMLQARIYQDQGFAIQDHSVFYSDQGRRHAVIFMKEGASFFGSFGVEQEQWNAARLEQEKKGFSLMTVQVDDLAGGLFSGIFRPSPNPLPNQGEKVTEFLLSLSPSEFLERQEEFESKNFRLMGVKFNTSTPQLSAVWSK